MRCRLISLTVTAVLLCAAVVEGQVVSDGARYNAPSGSYPAPHSTPAAPSQFQRNVSPAAPHGAPDQSAMRGGSVSDFEFTQRAQPAAYTEPETPADSLAPVSDPGSVALTPLSDPIPLAPKGERNEDAPRSTASPSSAFFTVSFSLAIVLGLFFALVWFSRKTGGKGNTVLPKDVVEVLGRSPLAPRQSVQVVRFGSKILLLSVTASGSDTLAEITDPEEVDRLMGLCKQQSPDSISESFRHVLSHFGSDSNTSGGWWNRGAKKRNSAGDTLDRVEA